MQNSINPQQCRDALSAEQAASLAATQQWAHVDKQQVHADWDLLYKALAPHTDQPADSPQIQAFMAQHYAIVSRFYAPSKLAYIGMSLFYQENPDMQAFHNAYHPKMVEFLGQAMTVYALAKL
jgi:hypothetical protein